MMTPSLQELKEILREAIDEVRLRQLWDDDRDVLVEWLKKEAELLVFGPDPEPPVPDEADLPWWHR